MGGYNLHLIKTNKFKTITIDVDFYRNIKKEEITERNLLKMVLLDSSNNYKTERDLIIESENLYDIKVSSSISRIGNFSNLSFQTKFLNEKYTEKDMNKESIIFFLDLIFNPNVKNNAFLNINKQKSKLKQDIISIKDNKVKYSVLKLMEKMKEKEYSYNTFGYLEDLEDITGEELYTYYEKVLKEDNTALEELLDIISNPKRVSKENKYQNKLLETKEKRNAICDLVREGKLELSYGVLVLNQLDETINSLEDHIERNKDRRPVFDFYQSLRESFIFHNADMLSLRDFDRTLSFFDYTDDKSVFNNKINRIKRKVLKTDK